VRKSPLTRTCPTGGVSGGGDGGPALLANLFLPAGVCLDGQTGDVTFVDQGDVRIRSVSQVCPFSWEGPGCQRRQDPCESQPCQNNGTCLASYTAESVSFACQCGARWSGSVCESELVADDGPDTSALASSGLSSGMLAGIIVGALLWLCILGMIGAYHERRKRSIKYVSQWVCRARFSHCPHG
jgi:hypothetical protein